MLYPVFTDILRLRIAISLTKNPSDFNSLKTEFLATDGNLSFHLKKLEADGVIIIEKSFRWKKPYTRLVISEKGREMLIEHLDELERIIREGVN